MPNLNEMCTFISVSDMDAFADYDEAEGYSNCCDVEGGIVVSNDMADSYRKLVEKFEEWVADEDED